MISYVPGTWYFVAPHGDGLRSIITCSCDLCRKPRKKPRRKSEDFHGNTTKLTEVPWKHYGSVKKVPHEAPYKVPRKSQGGPVGRPQSHKSPGRPMEITRKSNGSTTEVPPNPTSWYQRTPTKVPCKSHGSTKEAPREFHESPGEFPSNQHGIAMDFTITVMEVPWELVVRPAKVPRNSHASTIGVVRKDHGSPVGAPKSQ